MTALYLNPVFSSASNHRYHTFDYLAVDPLLGGTAALRELVDACHARGMKVVLDGVFNHASRGFWPFHHVLENGAASPYRHWFHFDQERLDAGRAVRAYPEMDELALLRRDASAGEHRAGELSLRHLGYRAWWDLPALPKLDTDNPEVREYLFAVAEQWLRFGIDGWRLDVPEEIDDDEFWREFRRRVKAIDPQAYIVAEIWREKPRWLQGDQFDALMNYPFTEAVIGFAAGRHLDREVVARQHEYRDFVQPLDGPAFAARLEHVLTMYDPAVISVQLNLLGSHDTPRFLTVCGGDRAALRLATLIQMTVPGAPCIYYGDEIGLEGAHDPDCRRSFPADPSAGEDRLRHFIRGAIRARHGNPVLRHGGYRTLAAEAGTIVYERSDGHHAAVVAVNAGEEPCSVAVAAGALGDRAPRVERWTGWDPQDAGASARLVGETLELRLPPREGLLLFPG